MIATNNQTRKYELGLLNIWKFSFDLRVAYQTITCGNVALSLLAVYILRIKFYSQPRSKRSKHSWNILFVNVDYCLYGFSRYRFFPWASLLCLEPILLFDALHIWILFPYSGHAVRWVSVYECVFAWEEGNLLHLCVCVPNIWLLLISHFCLHTSHNPKYNYIYLLYTPQERTLTILLAVGIT